MIWNFQFWLVDGRVFYSRYLIRVNQTDMILLQEKVGRKALSKNCYQAHETWLSEQSEHRMGCKNLESQSSFRYYLSCIISPHLGLFYNDAISQGSLCVYYVSTFTRCFRNKDMDNAIRISRVFNPRSKIIIQSSQLAWSPWGCKIYQNPVRLVGWAGPIGRRARARESEGRCAPIQTGFRQISRSRRPNRGLDGITRLLEVFHDALHGWPYKRIAQLLNRPRPCIAPP